MSNAPTMWILSCNYADATQFDGYAFIHIGVFESLEKARQAAEQISPLIERWRTESDVDGEISYLAHHEEYLWNTLYIKSWLIEPFRLNRLSTDFRFKWIGLQA